METLSNISSVFCNLIVGCFGIIILCLIPVICPTSEFNNSSYLIQNAFRSNEFRNSGTILLVTSLPILLDVALDFFTKNVSKFTQYELVGRIFYAIVTCFVGFYISLQNEHFHLFANYETSVWVALWCQRIIFISTAMFFLSYANPEIYGFYSTLSINVMFCLVAFSELYVDIIDRPLLYTIVQVYFYLFQCVSILFCVYWSFKLCKISKLNWNTSNSTGFLYLSLYMTFILWVVCFTLLSFFLSKDFLNSNIYLACFPVYSYIAVNILMTVIPGRIARQDAITSKDNIILTKKAYVRYISHELRTPMNIMFTGLQLGVNQISKSMSTSTNTTSNNNDNSISNNAKSNNKQFNFDEHLDTLIEVHDACEISLEILNDLLLYDKLDDGQIKTKKEEIYALEFISKTIKPFSVKLRAKKIQLHLFGTIIDSNTSNLQKLIARGIIINENETSANNSFNSNNDWNLNSSFRRTHSYNNIFNNSTSNTNDNNINENDTINVNENDIINVDKSKFSQVIRNLMSNAIKFTPDKGVIKVTARFEPYTDAIETSQNTSLFNTYMPYSFIRYFTTNRRQAEINYTSLSGSTSNPVNSPSTLHLTDLEMPSPRMMFNDNNVDDVTTDSYVTIKGSLIIEIQDNGAGISIDNQAHLFHEIVQFDPEKLQAGGGSGLGLWISKSIVDLHGGRISAYSEGENKGSTFRLEIPMIRRIYGNSSTASSPRLQSSSSIFNTNNTVTRRPSFEPFIHSNAHANIHTNSHTTNSNPNLNIMQVSRSNNNSSNSSFLFQNITNQLSSKQQQQHYINFNPDITTQQHEDIISTQAQSVITPSSIDIRITTESAIITAIPVSISNTNTELNRNTDTSIVLTTETDIKATQHNSNGRETTEVPVTTTTTNITNNVVSPMKILLVDDVPSCRKMMRRMLEDRGHYCEEAGTGLVAVGMVKELFLRRSMTSAANTGTATANPTSAMISTPIEATTNTERETMLGHHNDTINNNLSLRNYDVILMDFVMPTMNGPDATREIRALGYTKPIIGVTGNALESDKDIFINAGASNVIIKPLRLNVLLGIIDL